MKPGVSHVINISLYILSCIFILRTFQLLMPDKKSLMGWFDIGFAASLFVPGSPHPCWSGGQHQGSWWNHGHVVFLCRFTYLCCIICMAREILFVWRFDQLFSGLTFERKHDYFCCRHTAHTLGFGGPHRNKAWNGLAWLALFLLSTWWCDFRFLVCRSWIKNYGYHEQPLPWNVGVKNWQPSSIH